MRCRHRVVVVGAGAAGAAAANALLSDKAHADATTEVVLLEAQPHVGGRTHTVSVGGCPMDLGAYWIEGAGVNALGEQNPMSLLADRHGVERGKREKRFKRVDVTSEGRDGGKAAKVARDTHSRAVAKVRSAQAELQKNPDSPDTSAASAYTPEVERSQLAPEVLQWVGYYAANSEQYYGTSFSQQSCRFYDQDGTYGGPHHAVQGGYGTVVQKEVEAAVARGCKLRVNAEVTAVTDCGTRLRLDMASGESLVADSVILTAPIGVLKAHSIAFTPALPAAHCEAIERIGVASFNKVILEFERRFWERDVQCFGICGDRKGWFRHWETPYGPEGPHVLVCLMGGDAAAEVERLSDEEVQAEALGILQKALHKGRPLPPLKSFRMTRWNSDRHTRCGFSSFAVGSGPRDLETLARPVMGGKLILAGEHTDPLDYCSVQGAHNSGLRAAQQVLPPEAGCLSACSLM